MTITIAISAAILIVVFALLAAFLVRGARNERALDELRRSLARSLTDGCKAKGKVTTNVRKGHGSESSTFQPVVLFLTEEGIAVTLEGDIYSPYRSSPLKPGTPVDVIYDRLYPKRALVKQLTPKVWPDS